jgi:hypothetical protein
VSLNIDKTECYIERRYNKEGKRRHGTEEIPYLLISVRALEALLAAETAVIAPEDVPILMECICRHAGSADAYGDNGLADQLAEHYANEIKEQDQSES